ncbi:hypothetical protein TA3x_002894 [Tundrisphaera sp. TA3]|uniref:NHL domain-containing protein n=1 Tax=Tundrisphaera sp. TA3 TaxID=3435775 RepID=UPI003EB8664F
MMLSPTTFLLGLILTTADPTGVIHSDIGTGKRGFAGDGGPASTALLDSPFDLTFDRDGNLYFSDTNNHRIRRVDAKTGVITTVVGSGVKGFGGDGGPATEARLDEPYGVKLDRAGHLFFVDRLNRRVRRVDARTGLITTFAGNGAKAGSGDGGPAADAGLAEPNGIAFDAAGNLYIADVADHRVRKVDASTGIISTFAGTGKGARSGDGGPATQASLFGARAVAVGPNGIVYIAERQGNSLRAVDPASGTIRTLAGTGKKGNSGDGGPADRATFDGPKELCVDRDGNVLIVDTENHAIRRYDLATRTITTVAGTNGRKGSDESHLDRPHGVAVGPDGAIFIGDTNNHRIRRVAAGSR